MQGLQNTHSFMNLKVCKEVFYIRNSETQLTRGVFFVSFFFYGSIRLNHSKWCEQLNTSAGQGGAALREVGEMLPFRGHRHGSS